jgi:hypothetical protein
MGDRWLFAALALVLAVPASASQTLRASKDFVVGDASEVRVDFPAGSLEIGTSPDSRLHATMTARCKFGHDCSRRAENLRLVSETHGRTLVVKLEGLAKFNNKGLEVTLRLAVPRELELDVEMGAGELDVRGAENDVTVDVGAGDVEIRIPQQAVRSVHVDVGVGDATFRAPHGRVRGGGWISKHLAWDDGAGDARVRVHLGVGDASVMLD